MASSRGAGGSVLRKLSKKLEKMQQAQRYGPADNVELVSYPSEMGIRPWGNLGPKCYFQAPVSEILLQAARSNGKRSVYVTGVALEFDIYHKCPIDVMALCAVTPAAVEIPAVPLYPEKLMFDLAHQSSSKDTKKGDVEESRELWGPEHPAVASIAANVFERLGRDRSLFSAPTLKGTKLLSCVQTLNKTKSVHKGKVSVTLAKKGDPNGGLAEQFVKDSVRLWFPINKEVVVLDAADRPTLEQYSILCGVRPQTDLGYSGGKAPKSTGDKPPAVGLLKDCRIVVYKRK